MRWFGLPTIVEEAVTAIATATATVIAETSSTSPIRSRLYLPTEEPIHRKFNGLFWVAKVFVYAIFAFIVDVLARR